MNVEAIILRCTRNGVTAWQHVAVQLGCSVDSVRLRYDTTYLKIRPWPHPCEAVSPTGEPEPELEPTDLSSPYPKGIGMKAKILALLERQMMSVETMSGFLQSPVNSVRARLDRMLDSGQVFHDGAFPRSWGLKEADGTARVYHSGSAGALLSSLAFGPQGQARHTAVLMANGGMRGARWKDRA